MNSLELALTVFVWGLVPGLGLLGIFAATALNQIAELKKAQAANERRMNGGA